MRVIEIEEYHDEKEYEIVCRLDNNITSDSIIEIIKRFAGDKYSMSLCRCDTYSESGAPKYCEFYKIEDLKRFLNYAPNPSISFGVDFQDKESKEYAFELVAATNYNYLSYIVDKKRSPRGQAIDWSRNGTENPSFLATLIP